MVTVCLKLGEKDQDIHRPVVESKMLQMQFGLVHLSCASCPQPESLERKRVRFNYQRPLLELKAFVVSLKRGLCQKLNSSFLSATSRPAVEANESGSARSNCPLRSNRFFLRGLMLLLRQ